MVLWYYVVTHQAKHGPDPVRYEYVSNTGPISWALKSDLGIPEQHSAMEETSLPGPPHVVP